MEYPQLLLHYGRMKVALHQLAFRTQVKQFSAEREKYQKLWNEIDRADSFGLPMQARCVDDSELFAEEDATKKELTAAKEQLQQLAVAHERKIAFMRDEYERRLCSAAMPKTVDERVARLEHENVALKHELELKQTVHDDMKEELRKLSHGSVHGFRKSKRVLADYVAGVDSVDYQLQVRKQAVDY